MIPSKEICVAFTGYRPEKMPFRDIVSAEKYVRGGVRDAISNLYSKGYKAFFSGMAEGFDLWAADEALRLRESGACPELSVVAVIPFRGQGERYRAEFASIYSRTLEQASEVITLSENYYHGCYILRDDYLVDNSSAVICCFDGKAGGTKYTVSRARRKGLPVLNILDPVLDLF